MLFVTAISLKWENKKKNNKYQPNLSFFVRVELPLVRKGKKLILEKLITRISAATE